MQSSSADISADASADIPARIGTAGWSLPRETWNAFPTEGSQLERYATVFNAVEINTSFYRPHQPKTYERWAASTPSQFRFAVKLPRTITHEAKLHGIDALLARFAGEAGALCDKLGAVLVQLPPSLALDAPAAGALFDALHARFHCMIACEARHASWFTPAATDLLRQAGVTRVLADPVVAYSGPFEATAAPAYVRLHGNPRIYYSRYTPERMDEVRAWLARHPASWCILDNTASGAATANALELLGLPDQAAMPGRSER
ncbi:DUF72 domain-containing protein [Pseudoduganella umbonata]|uniref:DUF72 domain-containing protein n=1 Tax=Pseudoduganella umbonata TaxID=864828 RepID=A0A4P8HHS2_9BURK|nr:DUF72 domain-containing protein [Pseudoduganella umbonata]MBB3221738.1 uncharacterized protein YecE (DUF72 family) [Pseudoduganella umbonata]QCP09043.1 DUF72 domain-containing protein [Pseudoduganella umbonata]